jgi:adenylate cyclase
VPAGTGHISLLCQPAGFAAAGSGVHCLRRRANGDHGCHGNRAMSAKPSFFAELKRRNVVRAGVFYAAVVWALAQGLAQLLPVFNAPNWLTRWFVIACVLGFPFWLAFAWFYEITPTGVKRESEIDRAESITEHTGRKLDFWIIGILAALVLLLATNAFVLHRDATGLANAVDARTMAHELASVPAKSVAVLPFTEESSDPKQQYFSDGLTEELISDLTQIDGLKVIGKDSSFKFRGSGANPTQIGATLGVANLIQGSVRRQGNRIRVTVGMIRSVDGSSVWSHSYDEQLKDVFAIQSQIGRSVAAALKIRLFGQTIIPGDKPPGGDVQAYQLMLQGRAAGRHLTEAGLRQGIVLLQQALRLDPKYAYAWGVLSSTALNLGQNYLTGDARKHAYVQAAMAADKAQALAPQAAATHLVRGYLLQSVDNDPAGALTEYQRAYALAPNDGTTMSFLAGGLQWVGRLQPAARLLRSAIATDPLRTDFHASLASVLLAQGQLDAAEQAARKALTLQPDYPFLDATMTEIDVLRGDAVAAQRDASQGSDPVFKPWAQALAAQIDPDRQLADAAFHAYVAGYGKDQPYLVADLYALRKQPDGMFHELQRALAQQDPNFGTLLSDPFVLAYRHDPRFARLCQQAGLPRPQSP